MDYCDVLSDSHSDGTHSLQSIHCRDTDAETHFSRSDEEKLIGCSEGEHIFSRCLFLSEPFL